MRGRRSHRTARARPLAALGLLLAGGLGTASGRTEAQVGPAAPAAQPGQQGQLAPQAQPSGASPTELVLPLQDGSFEQPQGTAWQLEGACELRTSFASLTAARGRTMLAGGSGGGCVARQEVDLSAWPALVEAARAGELQAELVADMVTWYGQGIFEDRPVVRLRPLDEDGAALPVLETLPGGSATWQSVRALGHLHPRTARLVVEVELIHARGQTVEAAVDGVRLGLSRAEAVAGELILAPLLQNPRPGELTLQWSTSRHTAPAVVRYGRAPGSMWQRSEDVRTVHVGPGHYVHTARLEGLEAGTALRYRVEHGSLRSRTWRAEAPPEAGSRVRFGVFADNQDGTETFLQHVRAFAEDEVDVLLAAGDIVQWGHEQEDWGEQWYGPLSVEDLGQEVPVVFARGNHDLFSPYAWAYTAFPDNGAWTAYRYGEVFLVLLSTEQEKYHWTPTRTRPSESTDLWEDQAAFLQEALASPEARSAAWRVVVFHQAPYTNARHDDRARGRGEVRQFWVPHFEALDVDLVVAGHFHSYQRGEREGVIYTVVGGGGHVLDYERLHDWDHMQTVEMTWHRVIMDAGPRALSWRAVGLDGTLLDELHLERAGPPVLPPSLRPPLAMALGFLALGLLGRRPRDGEPSA